MSGPPFRFDRYRDGVLMAEGIKINRAATLEQAVVKAVALCREPRTVLVYVPDLAGAASPDFFEEQSENVNAKLRPLAGAASPERGEK